MKNNLSEQLNSLTLANQNKAKDACKDAYIESILKLFDLIKQYRYCLDILSTYRVIENDIRQTKEFEFSFKNVLIKRKESIIENFCEISDLILSSKEKYSKLDIKMADMIKTLSNVIYKINNFDDVDFKIYEKKINEFIEDINTNNYEEE